MVGILEKNNRITRSIASEDELTTPGFDALGLGDAISHKLNCESKLKQPQSPTQTNKS